MKFGASFRDPNGGLIKKFKGLSLSINAPWIDKRVEVSLEYVFYVMGTRNGYTIKRPTIEGVSEAKVQELVDTLTRLFAELRPSSIESNPPQQLQLSQSPLGPSSEDPRQGSLF